MERLAVDGLVIIPNVLTGDEVIEATHGLAEWVEKFSEGRLRREFVKNGLIFGGVHDVPVEKTNEAKLSFPLSSKGRIDHFEVAHQAFVWDVRSNPNVVAAWKRATGVNQLTPIQASFEGITVVPNNEWFAKGRKPIEDDWHVDGGDGFQGFVQISNPATHSAAMQFLKHSHLHLDSYWGLRKDERFGHRISDLRPFIANGCSVVTVHAPVGSLVIFDSKVVHQLSVPPPASSPWHFAVNVTYKQRELSSIASYASHKATTHEFVQIPNFSSTTMERSRFLSHMFLDKLRITGLRTRREFIQKNWNRRSLVSELIGKCELHMVCQ